MRRSPARNSPLVLFVCLLALGACVDRPNSAAASNSEVAVTGDSSRASRGAPTGTAGVVAVTAAAAAATKSANEPQPKRSRRDSVALASMTKPDSALDSRWPVKMPAPLSGSLLPANRILAFYGNPLSKKMGVLGEYPKDQMFAMLDREVARWAKADPEHPVIPALHFIVTVAQGAPGKNGLYRLQMRDSMTNAIHEWAKSRHALLFLDVQPGKSTVEAEVPRLRPFLENADVHLAIDPEFAMAPSGAVPSSRVGTVDAKDVNWTIDFLDRIVKEKGLPPKVLIVHRWTRKMVTNARAIRPVPNVQVVMDMDGWGPPWLKFDSYHDYIKAEPVQFTGFKLFFQHDTQKGDPLLTPEEVLRLNPRPLYIQYQ
ncbi:MAG TPA: hypothetical protein VGP25_04255 [Gemmatimonadaceae bacterium]|jgi:hypothetical protein|nr:hypothetical protein [Gemmatimonadaceae bacterium]